MRIPWRGIALIASSALVVAGCSNSSDSDSDSDISEVKIGSIYVTEGPTATNGIEAANGVKLAAEIVNGEFPDIDLPLAAEAGLPNLGGAKITLVPGESKGEPQTGANEADRLVGDEQVSALIGSLSSSVTKTVSERAEALQVPMINGESTAPALTERGLDWFFRVGPTDETYTEAFFTVLRELQGKGEDVTDVAILHADGDFGVGGADIITQLAEENGFEVVENVSFPANATDLQPQIQQLRSADPAAVFEISLDNDAALFAQTLADLNYTPPAVFGAFVSATLVEGAEDKAHFTGFSRRTSWTQELADRNPTAKAVSDMFEEEFGNPMNETSARTFTSMMTLAQAINDAGSDDPEKIRAALQNIDIPGRDTIMPWDGIKFDDTHQNTGARGVVEQFLNGNWTIVSPSDVAGNQKFTYPLAQARS